MMIKVLCITWHLIYLDVRRYKLRFILRINIWLIINSATIWLEWFICCRILDIHVEWELNWFISTAVYQNIGLIESLIMKIVWLGFNYNFFCWLIFHNDWRIHIYEKCITKVLILGSIACVAVLFLILIILSLILLRRILFLFFIWICSLSLCRLIQVLLLNLTHNHIIVLLLLLLLLLLLNQIRNLCLWKSHNVLIIHHLRLIWHTWHLYPKHVELGGWHHHVDLGHLKRHLI